MNTAAKPIKNIVLLNLLALTVVVIAVLLTRQAPPQLNPQPAELKSADDVRAAIAAAAQRREKALKPDPALANPELLARWGIEVTGIQRATAGYMMDFRFKVIDLDKALPLFDGRVQPYVQAERSGIKLPVPAAEKIGALRPTNRGANIKAGKIYSFLFANPDNHVKPGEKVTVVIGDLKLEHLTVR